MSAAAVLLSQAGKQNQLKNSQNPKENMSFHLFQRRNKNRRYYAQCKECSVHLKEMREEKGTEKERRQNRRRERHKA